PSSVRWMPSRFSSLLRFAFIPFPNARAMPAFSSIISHAAHKVNRTGKFVIKIYDFSRPFEEVRRALAFSGKEEYNCGMRDLHTHSAFSPDGVSPLEEMAARAHEQRLKYFGVSEHFDFDYAACGI